MKTEVNSKQKLQIALLTVVTYIVMLVFLLFTVLKNAYKNGQWIPITAYCALIAVFFVFFVIFFFKAEGKKKNCVRKVGAIYTVFVISYVVMHFTIKINYCFAPLAMCILILTQLVGIKIAAYVNISQLLIFFISHYVFETAITQLEALVCLFLGLATITVVMFSEKSHKDRLSYLVTALKIAVTSILVVTLFYFIFDGITSEFSWLTYTRDACMSCLGGIFDIMAMFLLVPLLERIFNITTNFRLAELANTNHPLLVRLLKEAPGTFSHSLTVANYAEACAMAIGENTYLARAAGCYHDIGKLQNPAYFSENQADGYNPHNEIAPEISVSFLKNHVSYGVSLARAYRLPPEIESAIVEHHGTFVMKFFYLKAKKYTEGELSVANYCYDGPAPVSKINSILMIADSCEATLRALSVSDKNAAEKVVDGIVSERMSFGQFDNSELSMKEIDIIKQTIISTYLGTKHERVKYPELKISADNGGTGGDKNNAN